MKLLHNFWFKQLGITGSIAEYWPHNQLEKKSSATIHYEEYKEGVENLSAFLRHPMSVESVSTSFERALEAPPTQNGKESDFKHMESVPVSDNLRIHSNSVKRKYTTTDIVIDGEGTPTVVAKKSSGPIYYAGDTATISDPYRKERDNYLNDKEYQQQNPATCGK